MVLGSGTSGTVFKMNFKRKDVAVKQIAKSDDKDEMKVSQSLHVIFVLYQFKSIFSVCEWIWAL